MISKCLRCFAFNLPLKKAPLSGGFISKSGFVKTKQGKTFSYLTLPTVYPFTSLEVPAAPSDFAKSNI